MEKEQWALINHLKLNKKEITFLERKNIDVVKLISEDVQLLWDMQRVSNTLTSEELQRVEDVSFPLEEKERRDFRAILFGK